ncbi:MAG: hypothetical protein HZA11_07250 [Nitrospirae bacterium]|nr:hypothetical protein [Nitrospirota bacterium]
MKWKTMNLPTRLYLISAIILLVGLGSALWIYLAAGDNSESVLGYEISGGNAYLVAPENSKKYVHDLKLIGGNAAVFADEFSRWFIGLWHGKSLAFTTACIAGFISLVFFFAARIALSHLTSGARDENNRAGNET